jgi:hypothetical protein
MKHLARAAVSPVLRLLGAEGAPLNKKEVAYLAVVGTLCLAALPGGVAAAAIEDKYSHPTSAPSHTEAPRLAAGCPTPDDPKFQTLRRLMLGRLGYDGYISLTTGRQYDQANAAASGLTVRFHDATMNRVTAAPNEAAVLGIANEITPQYGFRTTRGTAKAPLQEVKQDVRDLLADLGNIPMEVVRASGLAEVQLEVNMKEVDKQPGTAARAYKKEHLIRMAPGYGRAFSHEFGHHLRWAALCESGILTPLTQFNPPDFTYHNNSKPADFKGAVPDAYSAVTSDEDYADTASHIITPSSTMCEAIAALPTVANKTAMVATEADRLVPGAGTVMLLHMGNQCSSYNP